MFLTTASTLMIGRICKILRSSPRSDFLETLCDNKLYFRYFFHSTPSGGVKSLEAELHLDNKVRQNFSKVNGQAPIVQSG